MKTEIEEAVMQKIAARRDAGREKYGCSMERTDLDATDWIHHAQQEAMDLAVYLEKLSRYSIQHPATDRAKLIDDLATQIHEAARASGWWESREAMIDACRHDSDMELAATAQVRIAALGLICSEAGEAMDNVRLGCPPDDKLPQYPGAAVEVADIVIRALDLAGWEKWPIGKIIQEKLAKNQQRGRMHGGKVA
jgi:hypothetical protein